MRPVTEYFLCCIATPLLSEFPLHILELVDEKDAVTTPGHERHPDQKKPEHEKPQRDSLDHRPETHWSQSSNDLDDVGETAQRNKEYGIMLAIVAIPLLYIFWTVVSFTWKMHYSRQESLFFQCFYWAATLATAARLIYGLIACARFYIYAFRPWWLPEGIPLRVQAFQACGITLALVTKAIFIIAVGLGVKILVYDNLVKLAAIVTDIRSS